MKSSHFLLIFCVLLLGSPAAASPANRSKITPNEPARIAPQGDAKSEEAAAEDGYCEDFTSRDVGPGAPKFSDFRVATRRIKPVPAKITRDFRIFRTNIRRAVAAGPNFAGHFTFAYWGLAIGQRCWAIVDSTTGAVSADAGSGPDSPALYSSEGKVKCVTVMDNDAQEPQFRLDSRLLILTGKIGKERE